MKKIFLIGDSICFGAGENSPGYGICMKEKTDGIAEIYMPNVNCAFAQYAQRYLQDWAAKSPAKEIDIVHWNNGLWDLLHLCDDDEPFTPIDMYIQVLERVYKRIRYCFPNAEVIFASSTPVIEAWGRPGFMRYNSEIKAYNAAAKEMTERLGIKFNDLYAVAETLGEETRADWVHYNRAGSEALADAVIKACGIE